MAQFNILNLIKFEARTGEGGEQMKRENMRARRDTAYAHKKGFKLGNIFEASIKYGEQQDRSVE